MANMSKDFSPTFNSVSVGCTTYKSIIGSVSDFQIWDSVLPLDKMLSITDCQQSPEGNLLRWEGTNWQLNSSSNGTKYNLPFKDICRSQMTGSSLALIPYTMSMVPRALHQCSRLGGQVVGYSNETELHDTARFLVSRSVVHRKFGITAFFQARVLWSRLRLYGKYENMGLARSAWQFRGGGENILTTTHDRRGELLRLVP